MRLFKRCAAGWEEIDWARLADGSDAAERINAWTARASVESGFDFWWALRSSRRLPMEDWSRDLAALQILRRARAQGGEWRIGDVSRTFSLLLRNEEKKDLRIDPKGPSSASSPWMAFRAWVWKRRWNRFLLSNLTKPELPARIDLLMHTVLLPSQVRPDGSLQEMFFPGIPEAAEREGWSHLTIGITPRLPLAALRWNRRGNWVALDEWIGAREIAKIRAELARALREIQRWNRSVDELPAAWLKARWLDDLARGEFYDSLALSMGITRIARSATIGSVLYSFERKTFEQSALKTLRRESPKATAFGYQNAAVTPKHYHFYAYPKGCDVQPDVILTVGRRPTDWLAERAGYSREKLLVAGALRQPEPPVRSTVRRPLRNILVLWAEGREQYEAFWKFLREAWEQGGLRDRKIRIRLHPAIPFEFPGAGAFAGRYEIDREKRLEDGWEWADAILYASTSAAIVAMAGGLPVIAAEWPSFFEQDCVPDEPGLLHWRAKNPASLEEICRAIDSLSDGDAAARWARSREFAREYFEPVQPAAFLKTLSSIERGAYQPL